LKAFKIALRPQTDNTATIRASEATQKQTLGNAIKMSHNEAVPPQAIRTTAGAAMRPDPIKFSPLIMNFIEFYANEKYHLSNSLWSATTLF
jgi:hypothetical protein